MSELVAVECECGNRMHVEGVRLGKEGRCTACGVQFLLWPAAEGERAGAAWYLRVSGRQLGPFTPADLRRLASRGKIKQDTPVRKGVEGTWLAASHVQGLLDSEAPAASPSRPGVPQHPPGRQKPPRRRRAGGGRQRDAHSQQPDLARRLAGQPLLVLAMAVGFAVVVFVPVALLSRGGEEAPDAPTETTSTASGKKPTATPKPPTVVPVPPAAPPTLSELVTRAVPSVAIVLGLKGSGTGFLVAPNLIATNRHVIERELVEDVKLRFPDASKRLRGIYGAKLMYEDPELDLAFLAVDIALPPLSIATEHGFERGELVTVIGSPGIGNGQVLQNAVSRGMISSKLEIGGQSYHQLDIATNPGNSGGPVLDQRGEVIGVMTLKATGTDGLGFCIPLQSLLASLARAKRASTAQVARMRALHRMHVTAYAVLLSSAHYEHAGFLYVRAMEAAVLANEDQKRALRIIRTRVQRYLERTDRDFMQLVRKAAPLVLQDTNLPTRSRSLFKELWRSYTGLKRIVEGPSDSIQADKRAWEEWSLARDAAAVRFRTEEKIDVPEIERER